MSRRAALAVLLLAATCLPARAQDFLPPKESALAAIDAYAEVRAANADVEQARARADALQAGPHETQLTLSPLRRRVTGESIGGSDRANYNEWEVQLARPIRLPGKSGLDRESGEHGTRAAELRQGDAEHQAARTLLTRWMNWLRAAAAAQTARERHDWLAREQAALTRRVKLGDAAQRELDQMDAALASAEAESRANQADMQASRLALILGFPQVPVPENAPVLPEPTPLAGTTQDWTERIITRSHEIGALEETAAQHDALARRANAERYPDPTLGVRTFNEFGGIEHGIGVVLTIPFSGARRAAEARAEAAVADAAHSQAEAMRRDITLTANLTVTRAQTAIDLWQIANTARAANAASLEKQRRAYELGEIGLTERLQAERLDIEAAMTELRARTDAHEAKLLILIDSHELWHSN
ncbi:MAG: TolC family protein [Rhodanobacter sp.]|jgi:outer membrane protein TolC|nr:TolC family protein [Rhodanobacter sp.]